jgi:hypothetical protein
VALANKVARIAWAIMTTGELYRREARKSMRQIRTAMEVTVINPSVLTSAGEAAALGDSAAMLRVHSDKSSYSRRNDQIVGRQTSGTKR